MATKQGRIGLADVRALGPGQELWEGGKGAVTGFGIRRQRSPAVAYVVIYRTAEGRSRRVTIGRHGSPWTPDEAREKARAILAEALVHGRDPAAEKRERREAPTVAELCEEYLAAAEAGRLPTRRGGTKKASTLAADRSRIASHVLPLLGARKVAGVTTADLDAFMHDVAAGKTHRTERLGRPRAVRVVRGSMGVASRTVGMLGAIFSYAVKRGMRPDNPARGVLRPADGRRERRLSAEEYGALGRGLSLAAERGGRGGAKPMWPHAVAAIRFLAVTGWRSGEALALRWRDVELPKRTARLPDTKSGASMRALSRPACAILGAQRKATGGEPDALVFPPSRGAEGATMTGFKGYVARAVKLAGLPADVTAHVLRHSFASVAADLDMTELTIAALIGHRRGSVTSRYVHSADAVLLAAADRVAGEVARQMGEEAPPVADLAGARAVRAVA